MKIKNKNAKLRLVAGVVRGYHGLHANIYGYKSRALVTITREKAHVSGLTCRWQKDYPALLSWPGGNGAQTPVQTLQMAAACLWAYDISKRFNERAPDKLTDSQLLGKPPSGCETL